eukprot:TRINITY_DN2684_c0_g1_i11.p1 TRINITY_DN2684_c0_g1~~TRINITY_DN2684_c0_g1_i11.p1  ORF type:complete len:106 (+),score=29.60 TRINITY_DN2684_c0_g1_i11:336-653(+)
MADQLRRNMFQCNILVGGYDKEKGSSLYYLDYLATLQKLDKAAYGYGGYPLLTVMDANWKKDMSLEEGKELARKCIAEVQKRFIISTPNIIVKCIDANGVNILEL